MPRAQALLASEVMHAVHGLPLNFLKTRGAAAGIDKTVIFAAFSEGYLRANREVAQIVARHPQRLLGVAFVHPLADKGRVDVMVREAVNDLGLVGIKVHRHDGRITREICAAARRYRVPILYDVMGEVSAAEMLAEEYPDVAFIIPHLGSFADDWRAQTALVDHLVRHPNIFTDTAGVRRFDILEQAVRRAGARKVGVPRAHAPGKNGAVQVPGLGLKMRDLAANQDAG